MRNEQKKEFATRSNRTICLPFFQEIYEANIAGPIAFRKCIDDIICHFSELFSHEISNGYQMKDLRHSEKQNVSIRRIEIDGVPSIKFTLPLLSAMDVFWVHPSQPTPVRTLKKTPTKSSRAKRNA